jgi:antitoxin (DNA-binding transcriptional repressor) of toxin-antitoxin stability system
MLVKVHEAKTHLSRLIQRALEGEEIIIARGDKPLVKLVVVDSARRTRRLGTAKGQVKMTGDFEAPLRDFDGYE